MDVGIHYTVYACMLVIAASMVQLYVSVGNGCPHNKNRQQISTSPQSYQKIPVLLIICTTSLSVNRILSIDLITVIFHCNIVSCFVFTFIVLRYFMLFGLMATRMK